MSRRQSTFLLCPVATLLLLVGLLAPALLSGQGTAPTQGLHNVRTSTHALTHCNIVRAPGDILMDATMVIREGLVENVGKGIAIPSGTVVHDLHGMWVFPGFIDPYSNLGIEKPKREQEGPGAPPQYETKAKAPIHWNESVKPEFAVSDKLAIDRKAAGEIRALGFTTLNVVPQDGIFRGTSALVNLGEEPIHKEMLQPTVATCLSWDKGASVQSYPSSIMGTIALIRQTLLDAAWYRTMAEARQLRPGLAAPETNLALEALNRQLAAKLPILFDAGDWQGVLRAQRIATEFGLRPVFRTDATGYQATAALKATGSPLIVSLLFPDTYDLRDPADARELPLRRLWHWEAAPANAALLAKAGIPIAFSLSDLKRPQDFWPQLQKAIKHGLTAAQALAAVTTVPAQILGLDRSIGTLDPGKRANFFVADDDVFLKEKFTIYETWIAGRRYEATPMPEWDPRGQYQIKAGNEALNVIVNGRWTHPKTSLIIGKDTIDGTIKVDGRSLQFSFPTQKGKQFPQYRLYGIAGEQQWSGEGVAPSGARLTWSGEFLAKVPEKADTSGRLKPIDTGDIPQALHPFSPYGLKEQPKQKTWHFRGATVWTCGPEGRMDNADLIIAEGKVQAVGRNLLTPPGATVLDGAGLHITPGIIDEHSHIAISGDVNEGSHANTAEVRIGDVINSEDINIYRQLSGGVTTAQLLHGSANPIGGQSGIIKLRWGALPEDMKFAQAPGFIKFALGENVKQSNWGDQFRIRYPQTRMGVEQFIRDAFTAAQAYRKQLSEAGSPTATPVRRDLQMETLVEIMEQKRFITCHSYVQSEILMLMRLAESFGFKVNTFTHILEGYKIADVLKSHGANASTFSDWWAYKYEVIDAIPYNAAIMQRVGINVCVNSDDAEMARRLNQEAAKAVKYGGCSEEEALKMVTANPAKALHLDQWVGSLEKGKDADFVVWNAHPLSIYAVAQMTFVDGRLYFDRHAEREAQLRIAAERQRLIQKSLDSPDRDKKKPDTKPSPEIHNCETVGWGEYMNFLETKGGH